MIRPATRAPFPLLGVEREAGPAGPARGPPVRDAAAAGAAVLDGPQAARPWPGFLALAVGLHCGQVLPLYLVSCLRQ